MRELWSHRSLVVALTRRQFSIRYRQSALGVIWAVVVPLASLGAGTLVFDRIADLGPREGSYQIFTMAGLVPWVFFASSLAFGIGSIVQEKALVVKLSFPRAAVPLGMVGTSFLDLLIGGAIFVILAFTLGDGLHLTALWVPLLLLIEIPLVIGLVLFGSALNVFARDIRLGVPLLLQAWLLLTPVMYTLPPDLRPLYAINPMTGLVESFRRVLVDGLGPDWGLLIPTLVATAFFLLLGAWYFSATERRFADVI